MEKYLNVNRKWQVHGLSPKQTASQVPTELLSRMLMASCMEDSHGSKSMSGYVSDPKEDLKNRS